MVVFLSTLSYLEVVYQSCCYNVCFCLANFGLFSYIDRMIYLVLCIFVVYLVILLFLSTFGNTMSVSSAIITPFFERWFAFEIRVILIYVSIFRDFFN